MLEKGHDERIPWSENGFIRKKTHTWEISSNARMERRLNKTAGQRNGDEKEKEGAG